MPSHVLGFDLKLTRHFAHHQWQMKWEDRVGNASLLPTLPDFLQIVFTLIISGMGQDTRIIAKAPKGVTLRILETFGTRLLGA